MLELIKQRQIFASQDSNFNDIHIHLNPNPPTPEEIAEQDKVVEVMQHTLKQSNYRKAGTNPVSNAALLEPSRGKDIYF